MKIRTGISRTASLSFVAVAIVLLITGTAAGSLALPITKTLTLTEDSSVTTTLTLVSNVITTRVETTIEFSTVAITTTSAYFIQATSQSGLSGNSTNLGVGIRLYFSINTSAVQADYSKSRESALLVGISDFNTLSTANNISASEDAPIQRLSAGSCAFNLPFGIAVFKGYLDSLNISESNSSIPLFPILPCPFSGTAAYYVFGAHSDLAAIISAPEYTSTAPYTTTVTTGETYSPKPMEENITLTGMAAGLSQFTPFDPGLYTIAAGDQWGNLVVLHFAVSNSTLG